MHPELKGEHDAKRWHRSLLSCGVRIRRVIPLPFLVAALFALLITAAVLLAPGHAPSSRHSSRHQAHTIRSFPRPSARAPIENLAPDSTPTPMPRATALHANPSPVSEFVDKSASFPTSSERRRYRRMTIAEEIRFSFDGYVECALGADEAKPVTCQRQNWTGLDGSTPGPGIAVTLVDSLSTLLLANLTDQFALALVFVERELGHLLRSDTAPDHFVSNFEVTIRILGGLLSAYELSGERHTSLLRLARLVGDRLLPAYSTASGLPDSHVNLKTGSHVDAPWHKNTAYLAEVGSVMLELRTLSYHTRNSTFAKVANTVNAFLHQECPEDGLCDVEWNKETKSWQGQHKTVGSLGDSYYEYLLKQFIHSGFEDEPNLSRFFRAAASIVDQLAIFDVPHHAQKVAGFPRVFLGQKRNGNLVPVMDHLACFAGGLFALASRAIPWTDAGEIRRIRLRESVTDRFSSSLCRRVAEGTAQCCADAYSMSTFELGPDAFALSSVDSSIPIAERLEVLHLEQPFLLRPEAVESFFYLTSIDFQRLPTSQPRDRTAVPDMPEDELPWETHAWKAFVAMRRHCRVSHGYSGILNVRRREKHVKPSLAELDDVMQSFWIAETLKYLFLTFSVDKRSFTLQELDAGPHAHPFFVATGLLSDWVFNTEGHPLRIRSDLFDRIPPLYFRPPR